MKSTTKSTIKEWAIILLIGFSIGFLLHIGTNTAKLIWPTPPIQLEVSASE